MTDTPEDITRIREPIDAADAQARMFDRANPGHQSLDIRGLRWIAVACIVGLLAMVFA